MQCDVCGNHYENSFTVTLGDESYVFDCFECAIHALAPSCGHCGCKVIGHGVSREGEIFCCDHCARVALADVDDEGGLDEDEADELDAVDAEPDESEIFAQRRRR